MGVFFYWEPPPPRFSGITIGTVKELDPRRQGAQAGRFEGSQLGIGWSPSERGGQ